MNHIPSSDDHRRYMKLALMQAQKAYAAGEVPVGAVLVHENRVIASAHNMVETSSDATAHAEILCLRQASQYLRNWRLINTMLYCTLEPCAMCAGAMLLSRIHTLVWSAPDLRHGAGGSWIDLFSKKHPCHTIDIIQGICQDESAALLRLFFQQRRTEKKR